MTDVLTRRQRSRCMSRVRAENTKPEMVVRRYLHSRGWRFRVHYKKLLGKPDLAFPRLGHCVFVHGCFWHGHDCRHGKLPASNQSFWREKISRNRERDSRVLEAVHHAGWTATVVWSCQLPGILSVVESALRNAKLRMATNTRRRRPLGLRLTSRSEWTRMRWRAREDSNL